MDASPAFADRQWFIVGRWQEYEGEARANLLRIIAIAAFYSVELINRYGLNLGFIEMPQVRDAQFHQAVTALAAAWTMVALAVLLSLRLRFFPASLKFVSTACDIVLLTSILAVARLCPADRHRDDQHERHSVRARSAVRRRRGPIQTPHRSVPAVRRL